MYFTSPYLDEVTYKIYHKMQDFRSVLDLIVSKRTEVGKAQLEAQSATSAIAEVALRTKVFKLCCALIALRFKFVFG